MKRIGFMQFYFCMLYRFLRLVILFSLWAFTNRAEGSEWEWSWLDYLLCFPKGNPAVWNVKSSSFRGFTYEVTSFAIKNIDNHDTDCLTLQQPIAISTLALPSSMSDTFLVPETAPPSLPPPITNLSKL